MSKTDDMRKQRESSQPKRRPAPFDLDAEEERIGSSLLGVPAEPPAADVTYPVAMDSVTTETVTRFVTRKHRKPKPVGTQHLGVRCSPDELERWQARADSEGRSLGNWVRRMLNNV